MQVYELKIDAKTAFTLQRFSGADEHWPNWSVRAEGHFGMLGWQDLMDRAAATQGAIDFERMNDTMRTVSRDLFHVLIQAVEGKAFNIVRRHRGHGLAAWRDLVQEYAGSEAGRRTALLRAILNPGDEWAKPIATGHSFSEAFDAWDLLHIEFIAASNREIADEELVAIVLEHRQSSWYTSYRIKIVCVWPCGLE